jgi:anthranilate synthase component 1
MHAVRGQYADPGTTNTPSNMTPVVQTVGLSIDLADLHRANPLRYPHLLQSTAHGRYDILFAFPGASLLLDAGGKLQSPDGCGPDGNDFLDSLDGWWQLLAASSPEAYDLPFTGGWFIYLGYELAGQVEPRLQLPQPGGDLPIAVATRFATAVVHDRERALTHIVGETGQEGRVAEIAADIEALPASRPKTATGIQVACVHEQAPQRYLDAVERIHDYIREGDVFQVNLSRPWDIHFDQPVDAVTLFNNLGVHNPAPFSGLFSWQDTAVISSSPERLVAVRDGVAAARPIAGTRPRSRSAEADAAYSSELLAHPKERAEHIMLIDLERNDLGRICVPGSIKVDELMVLESYAHVHHIVSNVRGRLRDGVRPGQVIRAMFPGGTITGCPKVRCMEIIAELEQEARDAYTGSMGYINRDGSMDLNILIRSMVSDGRRLRLRAGAGIVADSVAAAELDETRAKARGILRALGLDQA